MPETPLHKLRYPESGDPATIAAYFENLAKDTEREFEDIGLDQLPAGTSGQLIIVQGTGEAAYKAMSGDATISSTGAVTIGSEKVGTSKIANLAVSTAKLADGAATEAKIGNGAVTRAKTSGFIQTTRTPELTVGGGITVEGEWEFTAPFADSSYTVSQSLQSVSGSTSDFHFAITSRSATKISFKLKNSSGVSTKLILHLIAIHD